MGLPFVSVVAPVLLGQIFNVRPNQLNPSFQNSKGGSGWVGGILNQILGQALAEVY